MNQLSTAAIQGLERVVSAITALEGIPLPYRLGKKLLELRGDIIERCTPDPDGE